MLGAVLGKANALQLAVMVISEMVFFNMNLSLCLDWLQSTDQGGSIVVHTFGAFFGMVGLVEYSLKIQTPNQNLEIEVFYGRQLNRLVFPPQ